jgi:RNA polymerase sigma-70 factor, ECF subfamily
MSRRSMASPDPSTDLTMQAPAVAKDTGAQQPASLEQLTDEQLMQLIRADDEAAYRVLLLRHVYRAQRLAMRLLGDRTAAEDAIQDVFLQIWVKRADWQATDAKFTSWLYRVVYNRSLDLKRKRREAQIDEAYDPPDEGADAVTRIYRSQVLQRLRAALSQLPEQQYLTLFLHYHEGYSAREAAEALGITLQAAESLLKRGRRNLRESLKREQLNVHQAFPDD